MTDDILTRDTDGNLAVRTVSSTGDNYVNPDDVYTRDSEGNLCVRVTGQGGSDQHNLGYFATQAALEEAYPTAEAGDWAIVGATDTVWIWDTDTSAWKDSDQKGQVTSVNNKTGAVVLDASDVDAIPQYSTMPTATAEMVGNIVQFTGTTNANYTNGYFYKCVSDGQQPATYSWTQVNVQPQPADPIPTQSGNAGKFLTTNGTTTSWADITSTPATMPTLTVADWSNNTQTVNVTGVTATNTVFVSPAPASAADYASAGIVCTAQGNGTLSFSCQTVPSNAIVVNVVCL